MIDALLAVLAAAALGLALGSIPFGLLLTRAAGLGDIRRIGSGNIGATNVLRTGRRGLAAATLVLDALKGTLAVLLAGAWLGQAEVAAVAAVLGHCHSVWLGGQGGKGVAAALGAFLGLSWPVFLAAAGAWLLGARLTRISSAGSLAAMAAAPVVALPVAGPAAAVAALAIALYVAWRHRGNIARLRAGTEPRIGAAPGGAAPVGEAPTDKAPTDKASTDKAQIDHFRLDPARIDPARIDTNGGDTNGGDKVQ